MDTPVPVWFTGRQIAGFRYRGQRIQIAEVVETWTVTPPWWQHEQWDRSPYETWYRVRSTGGGLFELATADGKVWRLCRIWD